LGPTILQIYVDANKYQWIDEKIKQFSCHSKSKVKVQFMFSNHFMMSDVWCCFLQTCSRGPFSQFVHNRVRKF